MIKLLLRRKSARVIINIGSVLEMKREDRRWRRERVKRRGVKKVD